MSGLALRPLMPEDEREARAGIIATFDGTRYLARLLEQLDAALRFEDPEYMAVLAHHAEDASRAVGLALFGTVAGASRCTKVHAIVGQDDDCRRALAEGLVHVAADSEERLALAELPDDAPFAAMSDALLASGFVEEGRVPDFIADGVALRLVVWRP